MSETKIDDCSKAFEIWKKSLPDGQGYSAFDAWQAAWNIHTEQQVSMEVELAEIGTLNAQCSISERGIIIHVNAEEDVMMLLTRWALNGSGLSFNIIVKD